MSRGGGCMIPGCEWGCTNQSEHYTRLKGVTKRPKPSVITPESVTKKLKKPVSTTVSTKKPVSTVSTKSEYGRVKTWRLANREKYNEQMKEYRKKRAK